MAYKTMKKLITNDNLELKNGEITEEEYVMKKADRHNKLDVFLACNRITSEQYKELIELFN